MRLGRHAVDAVGRQHVLRAGGEDDDEVALGAQRDRLVRPGHRRAVVDLAIGDDRRVLEEVQGTGRLGRPEAERGERGGEIVGAVVVIARGAELLVAIAVAGGDQRVGANSTSRFRDRWPCSGQPYWFLAIGRLRVWISGQVRRGGHRPSQG